MARKFAALIAVVGWLALGLQFAVMLVSPANESLAVTVRVIRFFSFFTILTNLLVAIAATAIAFFPLTCLGRYFSGPSVQAAVAVYITIVGIIYSLFLRTVWNPVGWQAVADHLLHDAVPLAFLVYWLLFGPKGNIGWTEPLKWLVYPLAYVAYSLARGALVSWYPTGS